MSSAAEPGTRPAILVVGNFVSGWTGSRGVCEDFSDRLEGAGWIVYRTSTVRLPLLRVADMMLSALRLGRRISVAQVEVFSGRAFGWAEAVCWILGRSGVPYILTLHGGALPEFASSRPQRVTRLLRSAAAVTTPSRYLKDRMEPFHAGLRVVPNALDLARYPFHLRDSPAPRLVWVRAFHRIYNPALAVRVLDRLRSRFPDIRLTMVGPDKGDGTLAEVQALAARLGVSDRLTICGAQPKSRIPAMLGEHDVFLNTTDVDNTPVSVLEAMACGLCVVSTDVGGIPFLLEHERTALLCPPRDAPAMSALVERLLVDGNGLATRLSREGRVVAEGISWDQVLPRWEELLLDACAPGGEVAAAADTGGARGRR
jgi:glycosyltransferase involved in cell wall biosynthesis